MSDGEDSEHSPSIGHLLNFGAIRRGFIFARLALRDFFLRILWVEPGNNWRRSGFDVARSAYLEREKSKQDRAVPGVLGVPGTSRPRANCIVASRARACARGKYIYPVHPEHPVRSK